MSDDDGTPDGAAAAPEVSRGWSEQDRRTLIIAIVGGLVANLGTVIPVGAAIAFVRWRSRHGSGPLTSVFSFVIVAMIGALLIYMGNGVRQGRASRFEVMRWPRWFGWLLLGVGLLAALEVVMA